MAAVKSAAHLWCQRPLHNFEHTVQQIAQAAEWVRRVGARQRHRQVRQHEVAAEDHVQCIVDGGGHVCSGGGIDGHFCLSAFAEREVCVVQDLDVLDAGLHRFRCGPAGNGRQLREILQLTFHATTKLLLLK
jgi:hypothetical protein